MVSNPFCLVGFKTLGPRATGDAEEPTSDVFPGLPGDVTPGGELCSNDTGFGGAITVVFGTAEEARCTGEAALEEIAEDACSTDVTPLWPVMFSTFRNPHGFDSPLHNSDSFLFASDCSRRCFRGMAL